MISILVFSIHIIDEALRKLSSFKFFEFYATGIYRWQDGAIVANNPTIFAIREAQLLWPDSKIDCLVSIGCGSVPTKVSMDSSLTSFVSPMILPYVFIPCDIT